EDDPPARLAVEADFHIRGERPEGELAGEVHDSPPSIDVPHVHPVHPADQGRSEPDDVLYGMAHPLLRGVEDLRVAVDGRYQGTDEHLRIAEPADEHGRRSEEHTSELQSRENLVCR